MHTNKTCGCLCFFIFACALGVNAQTQTFGYSAIADYRSETGKDAYLVFQEALNNISRAGGGVLKVEEGTYILSYNVDIGENTSVIGAGMNQTIFVLQRNAKPWWEGTNKRAGFFRADLMDNIYISDLTLDGNKQNQKTDEQSLYGRYGFFTEGCKNVSAERVRITGFQGYGFDPHGYKKEMIYGEYLTIVDCLADNNDWDGFTLDQTEHMYIKNNIARNNGRHGFNVVTGTKYALLENNFAYDNGYYDNHGGSGCGIMVQNNQNFGTGNIIIRNNELYNSKKAGVCLNDVYNISVSHNKIEKTQTGNCMDIELVKDADIYQNLCIVDGENKIVNSKVIITDNVYSPTPVSNWTTPSAGKPPFESPVSSTPQPTPTPMPTPQQTPSPSPSPTPQPTPSPSPMPMPTPQPKPSPTSTPSPMPSPTPTPPLPPNSSGANLASLNMLIIYVVIYLSTAFV